MSYTPRPGSIGERSIEYLRGKGKVLSKTLALELDTDNAVIHPSMNLPVQHGLVMRETADVNGVPRTFYWLPGEDAEPKESPICGQMFTEVAAVNVAHLDAPDVSVPAAGWGSIPLPGMPAIPQFVGDLPQAITEPEIKVAYPPEGAGERVVNVKVDVTPAGKLLRDSIMQMCAQPAPATKPQHFELGAFSDGRLVMEYGDEQLTLSRAERAKLLAFLRAHVEPA